MELNFHIVNFKAKVKLISVLFVNVNNYRFFRVFTIRKNGKSENFSKNFLFDP